VTQYPRAVFTSKSIAVIKKSFNKMAKKMDF